jgi:hypothetical protein
VDIFCLAEACELGGVLDGSCQMKLGLTTRPDDLSKSQPLLKRAKKSCLRKQVYERGSCISPLN